jgi:glutamate-1-semialdehyde 2,1-aminomutase|tara:strand:- start:484 stop:1791 length:1308 start_codon:yes stop_codon:yes gene_type:complete
MSKGQKLYLIAKKIILGGNMLLSKRPEMFLPNLWPSYYSRAKDIYVWDLNKKKYTDMICAVGQSILGYSNKKLNSKISKAIKMGNMTTLNCPEEVELTKKLLSLHPWAKMAKYARSGGEANAIAIRIARAATKKDAIAICGYHGWHDWYLSVNLRGKNKLSKHLLKGLDPLGVPKSLKNTVYPFNYGDFDEIEKIVKSKKVGTIKMEVSRLNLPDVNFLKKIRKLATKNKIVLIFDECTSGFRQNFGGLHMKYKIYPDIAMFGKALGNGYAITSVIGRKAIMKSAESSFISSTFWTERLGFVAGLETLKIMEQIKSWNVIRNYGKYFNQKIENLANKYELKINITGIESITSFNFLYKKNIAYKTFISQEMLKKKYLASNQIFITIYHTKKIINEYINKLDPVFKKIKYFENNDIDSKKFLKDKICHQNFQRLNS